MSEALHVKGMILQVSPQGDYGRRIVLLTDFLGKITVFARGASKMNSKMIGALRPMTAAEFELFRSKGAYGVKGVRVIDSFEEIALNPDLIFLYPYVLEFMDHFSKEGMLEQEAKSKLNLLFKTLEALRDGKLERNLVRRFYELKMLVLEGVYTEDCAPRYGEEASALWRYVIASPLSKLYDAGLQLHNDTFSGFEEAVQDLLNKEVLYKFKSMKSNDVFLGMPDLR